MFPLFVFLLFLWAKGAHLPKPKRREWVDRSAKDG